jgi:Ca2+-binding EF-hand superfamily protein
MTRYRRGKSLLEIFQHFDRSEKLYFDSNDFVLATSDLRLETSSRVAAIAVNIMAIDGFDKVSYGEFKVFVLDSDHKLLELNIQHQLAQQLENQGRNYQTWMSDIFWSEEDSLNDSARLSTHSDRQNGMISQPVFVNCLINLGAVLTASEINRLVDRFDIHCSDVCSV